LQIPETYLAMYVKFYRRKYSLQMNNREMLLNDVGIWSKAAQFSECWPGKEEE